MNRTIVIGDVHGCRHEFEFLLRKLAPRPGVDRVICIGDLLDKGPDPVGCLRLARERGFECILGNHEAKHLRWRDSPEGIIRRPGMNFDIPLTHEDLVWMRSLPAFLRVTTRHNGKIHPWVLVHGGLFRSAAPEDHAMDDLTRVRWVRERGRSAFSDEPWRPDGSVLWTERYTGTANVVYGHTPALDGRVRYTAGPVGQCIGIDTGCVHGGALTALVLETFATVQVPAQRSYHPFPKEPRGFRAGPAPLTGLSPVLH